MVDFIIHLRWKPISASHNIALSKKVWKIAKKNIRLMHAIDRRNFIISKILLLLIVCRLKNSRVKVNLSQTFLYFLPLLLLLLFIFSFLISVFADWDVDRHILAACILCANSKILRSDYFPSYPPAIAHTWNILARHIIIKVIMMYMAWRSRSFFSSFYFFFFSSKRSRDCELVLIFFRFLLDFWQFLAVTHKHNVQEDYH